MLVIATFFLYFDAFFNLLGGGFLFLLGLVLLIGQVGGGLGLANEKMIGYYVAVAMAFAPFILRVAYGLPLLGGGLINLMFEVALIGLLLHPDSRRYVKLWFK